MAEVRVGVERDGAHVIKAIHGFAVERFNICQRVAELQSRDAHLVGGQAVKHESVIGIRAMRNADFSHLGNNGRSRHKDKSYAHYYRSTRAPAPVTGTRFLDFYDGNEN